MSHNHARKLTPHRLDLSLQQQQALDHFEIRHLKDKKPSTKKQYLRDVALFLQVSGHYRDHLDASQPAPITEEIWKSFKAAFTKVSHGKAQKRLPAIARALKALFPTLTFLQSDCRKNHALSGHRNKVISIPKKYLPSEEDQNYVDFLESTERHHRGDDYRRFLGYTALAEPSLLALPISERFAKKTLRPHLDRILEPLDTYEQYQRLHLLGSGLNEWMACDAFSWLDEDMAARRLAKKPRKQTVRSQSRKPSRGPKGLAIKDMQSEPFLSMLDAAFPTQNTPRDRYRDVKIVTGKSRQLFEGDFLHLLNARIFAKIGTPTDEPKALFSQQSINALESYALERMTKRTTAKLMVRIRSMYTRLHERDKYLFEHMKIVARRNFKADPPKTKSTDDIDYEELVYNLRSNLSHIKKKIESGNGNLRTHDTVEFRDVLVMTLLALTGLRIANIAKLRSFQIVKLGNETMIQIDAKEVKNKLPVRKPIPKWAADFVDLYRSLPSIKSRNQDCLWLSKDGNPVSICALQRSIKRYSQSRLQRLMTAHDFRRLFSGTALKKQIVPASQIHNLTVNRSTGIPLKFYRTEVRPNLPSALDKLLCLGGI